MVFDPSSLFRHLLLSLQQLNIAGHDGKVVLLIDETDGGTDHANTNVQGQIADVSLLFLSNAMLFIT